MGSHSMQYTWLGAAMAEDIDRLWEYLENGQDVNERGGHFNKTAMEEAIDNGGFWTARFLMVKGAVGSVLPAHVAMPEESSVIQASKASLQSEGGPCTHGVLVTNGIGPIL